MTEADLERQEPQALARLMNIHEVREGRWGAGELQDILQHQLEAPLLFDFASVRQPWAARRATEAHNDEPASFGELFAHPRPPKELLLLVKEFAKTSDRRDNASLPPEISTVLYYAAILAALLRLNEQISTLSKQSLAEGIRWSLAQSWLSPIRGLFLEGLANVCGEQTHRNSEREANQ